MLFVSRNSCHDQFVPLPVHESMSFWWMGNLFSVGLCVSDWSEYSRWLVAVSAVRGIPRLTQARVRDSHVRSRDFARTRCLEIEESSPGRFPVLYRSHGEL